MYKQKSRKISLIFIIYNSSLNCYYFMIYYLQFEFFEKNVKFKQKNCLRCLLRIKKTFRRVSDLKKKGEELYLYFMKCED